MPFQNPILRPDSLAAVAAGVSGTKAYLPPAASTLASFFLPFPRRNLGWVSGTNDRLDAFSGAMGDRVGYGESLWPGTPTIRWLKRAGIREPINALTALFFICPMGLLSPATSRELEWGRCLIVLNGLTSCFMHSTLPQDRDSAWKRFVADMDGSSMLAALVVGFAVLLDGAVPVEASLGALLVPPALDLGVKGGVLDVLFGVGWAAIILLLVAKLPPEYLPRHAAATVAVLIAAFCQIFDKSRPPDLAHLSWVRRHIALHSVWHVVAAVAVVEQMRLLEVVQTVSSAAAEAALSPEEVL